MSLINCEHPILRLYEMPLSDGRASYREVCVACNKKMPWFVPMTADVDMPAVSYKYAGKRLGEIAVIDKEFLRWVVEDSKASPRMKNAARRIYQGRPFAPKKVGEAYSFGERYQV